MKTHSLVVIAAALSLASSLPNSALGVTEVLKGSIVEILDTTDLFLDPFSNVLAVAVYGDDGGHIIRGVTFTSDKTGDNQVGFVQAEGALGAGVEVNLRSTHFIDNWAVAQNFTGPDASALTALMRDIRWSNAPNAVTADITGLNGNTEYNLQLLFNEGADRNRRWDISVNDELVVDDFTSEGDSETGQWTNSNTFVWEGNFIGAPALNIVLQQHIGGQSAVSGDNNPILSGIILHELGDIGTPGDFDDNGVVNVADYAILAANLGVHLDREVAHSDGDFNFDRKIDLDDFGEFKAIFPGVFAAATGVPEPATLGLAGLLLTGMLVTGRRRRTKRSC